MTETHPNELGGNTLVDFTDDVGNAASREAATRATITVYDAAGSVVETTYGTIERADNMSFLLWVDEKADKAVDLGNPFLAFKAFGEMGELDNGERYPDLYMVPHLGEQTVDPVFLSAVSNQARAFLDEHGEELGEHAKWVLEKLDAGVSETLNVSGTMHMARVRRANPHLSERQLKLALNTLAEQSRIALVGGILTTNADREAAIDGNLYVNAFCPTGPGGGVDPTCGRSSLPKAKSIEYPHEGGKKEFAEFKRQSQELLDKYKAAGGDAKQIKELEENVSTADYMLSGFGEREQQTRVDTALGSDYAAKLAEAAHHDAPKGETFTVPEGVERATKFERDAMVKTQQHAEKSAELQGALARIAEARYKETGDESLRERAEQHRMRQDAALAGAKQTKELVKMLTKLAKLEAKKRKL